MNEYKNKETVLHLVQKYKIWPEELMGPDFDYFRLKMLNPKERQILELKTQFYLDGVSLVEGNREICKLMRLKPSSLRTMVYEIRKKLVQNCKYLRVDDYIRKYNWQHPEESNEDEEVLSEAT